MLTFFKFYIYWINSGTSKQTEWGDGFGEGYALQPCGEELEKPKVPEAGEDGVVEPAE